MEAIVNLNRRAGDGNPVVWLPKWEHDHENLYQGADAERAEAQSKRDYDEAIIALRCRHAAVIARLSAPAAHLAEGPDAVSA